MPKPDTMMKTWRLLICRPLENGVMWARRTGDVLLGKDRVGVFSPQTLKRVEHLEVQCICLGNRFYMRGRNLGRQSHRQVPELGFEATNDTFEAVSCSDSCARQFAIRYFGCLTVSSVASLALLGAEMRSIESNGLTYLVPIWIDDHFLE